MTLVKTYTYRKEILSYRATAGAATKAAKRHALFAADQYKAATGYRTYAAQLMQTGQRQLIAKAAEYEALARTMERLGDRFIQHSAFQDSQAVFYRELAAKYAAMSRPVEYEY